MGRRLRERASGLLRGKHPLWNFTYCTWLSNIPSDRSELCFVSRSSGRGTTGIEASTGALAANLQRSTACESCKQGNHGGLGRQRGQRTTLPCSLSQETPLRNGLIWIALQSRAKLPLLVWCVSQSQKRSRSWDCGIFVCQTDIWQQFSSDNTTFISFGT